MLSLQAGSTNEVVQESWDIKCHTSHKGLSEKIIDEVVIYNLVDQLVGLNLQQWV